MLFRNIFIRGFKSISYEGQGIPLEKLSVLIGANGAGKSNLVSAFRLLSEYGQDRTDAFFQFYGADRVFHNGIDADSRIDIKVGYENGHATINKGGFSVIPGVDGRVAIADENVAPDSIEEFKAVLSDIRTYQFHNTSNLAKIRGTSLGVDAGTLYSDGANLAAYLHLLKSNVNYRPYYDRIVSVIRMVMPQFGDFVLDPIPGTEETSFRLDWRLSNGLEYKLFPSQFSDGALRFIALATVLLQPLELRPAMLVIDEPELGLHPMAIVRLASMIKSYSKHSQILIATQSPNLLNEFEPHSVIVIEYDRIRNCSVFRKLDENSLKEWLDEECLSVLWEKNVLGGQP
ncbi:MAG: AAA family ATPase [Victivallales bacterium]|nr:AAA family ATPase [Victivallales bacterium]